MTDLSDVARPRGRYAGYTRDRLAAFARRLERAIYPERVPVERILMAGPSDRISVEAAVALSWRPAALGEELGPLWATYWFEVAARVPLAWAGSRVDLYWDSVSEALLRLNGLSVAGLNVGRPTARLVEQAAGGERLTFQVEVACNRAFGRTAGTNGPGAADAYRLVACELRRFDPDAWRLFHDFETLRRLEADRAPPQTAMSVGAVSSRIVRPALDTTWAGRLLHDLNLVANHVDPDDSATWGRGQKILGALLAVRNGGVTHELSAVGHAHIDTAWLWPIEETRRKCQRTFATALRLMDAYPDFRFAASQACQYALMEETDPDLFGRILDKVATGQWIPVGGAWVEPDCNLPSGESLTRQLLYGQRYFERTFGARARLFWNPDVFGYAGQLPQILREAGMDRFLTQKLSWNRFTSPPHHSFRWRGLDGSEVLTHFPPGDTYNGVASLEELRYHAANYKDADRSEDGLYLFGYGDGGGGPTAGMIETLRRTEDLLGAPRASLRAPGAFFDRLERRAADLAVIEGELYFEYHRGTYTSQAEVKRLNRLIEGRLQDLDFLCAAAVLAGGSPPSREAIERLWRVLMVNQFHDILPGSSITAVYERAHRELADLAEDAETAARAVVGDLSQDGVPLDIPIPLNTIGFSRAEIALDPSGVARFVVTAPFAAGKVSEPDQIVHLVVEEGGGFRLDNGRLAARLSEGGSLVSLVFRRDGAKEGGDPREVLSGEANRIVLLDDRPTAYEAWDIDPFALETARDAPLAHHAKVLTEGPLRAEVAFERRLGRDSVMRQIVRLDAGAGHVEFDTVIDWRERRTLAKAIFPIACRSPRATYETAFGAVERPTHANTDADLAMYEVPGHRWADYADPGLGVSLLTDSRYGYSVFDGRMSLSLVRGPMVPDPTADIGEHRFRYGLFPHGGDWRAADTVGVAARFNRPVLWLGRAVAPVLSASLVSASPASVVVDTIKPAEDGEGWVVRLYESHGGQAAAVLSFGVPVTEIWLSNTLEDRLSAMGLRDGACEIPLRGFQIVTLRVI